MTSTFVTMRMENPNKYPEKMGNTWSEEDDTILLRMASEGKSHNDIASILKRTEGGVYARLKLKAFNFYERGISLDRIAELTGLNADIISETIHKRTLRNIQTQRNKEAPVQKTDMTEIKLLLYEIRDCLKEMVSNQKRILEAEGI